MNKYANPLPQLSLNRLRGHLKRLENNIWKNSRDLPVEIAEGGAKTPVQASRLSYRPVKSGEIFARTGWDHRWFRIETALVDSWRATVEDEQAGYLEWTANGETLIYAGEEPWHGLDTAHLRAPLPPAGGPDLYLRCGTYQTGLWMRPGEETLPPVHDGGLVFYGARLREKDLFFWEMFYSTGILLELIEKEMTRWRGPRNPIGYQPPLSTVPPVLRKLLSAVDEAVDFFDLGDRETYRQKIKAVYAQFTSPRWENRVALIGNSHIDLVWLWPEMVTEDKTLHTCATMLRLMDKYDDFLFTFTQPEMLARLEAFAPSVYGQVKKRIAEGRWEMTGAMEVEGDSLLPCGEALVRNFLSGQKRFQKLTGEDSRILWLPDAFGFSCCLPQIAAQAGVKYFFTTKLLWSALRDFPHGSFIWESPDGSSLVAHYSRLGYEARGTVEEVEKISWNYPQGDVHDESLLALGFGDGGGGVTEEHCERVRRLASLATLPHCSWRRGEDFFCDLDKVREKLPVHRGELYLEFHRGTYTTMARMKELYRRAERTIQTLEAALAATGQRRETTAYWKRIIFCQFHDALPGSSIETVYEQLFLELEGLIATMEADTRQVLGGDSGAEGVALFNPHAIGAVFTAEISEDLVKTWGTDINGLKCPGSRLIPLQKTHRGFVCGPVKMEALQGLLFKPVHLDEADISGTLRAAPLYLSNGRVSMVLDMGGSLKELSFDGIPVELTGFGGFALFKDNPAEFEAWDIDQSSSWLSLGSPGAGSFTVIEEGPVRAQIQGECALGERSHLTVSYILEAGLPILKVRLVVDWQERGALLKYQIPMKKGYTFARYGAPFNGVTRPAYSGTDDGRGLWEVPGSRWMEVTDGLGRGLGILTKDKYGFSFFEETASLTLLRSPLSSEINSPGAEGPYLDRGKHTIEFSLASCGKQNSEVFPSTAQLADLIYTGPVWGRWAGSGGIAVIDPGTLTVSWVKPAEDGPGMVIRLHETAGASGAFRFSSERYSTVMLTDIREGQGTVFTADEGGGFQVSYGAHQILTLVLGGTETIL